eukprot:5337463-Prymnesium_polylepis.1
MVLYDRPRAVVSFRVHKLDPRYLEHLECGLQPSSPARGSKSSIREADGRDRYSDHPRVPNTLRPNARRKHIIFAQPDSPVCQPRRSRDDADDD